MRELVVLGTGSQVPTRARNHNGYLLRWDGQGILFDPGEGTQRQMAFAGVAAADITQICLSHFHGDHCLGLPGVIQRLSLDQVAHPVVARYPASGQEFYDRLRHASAFYDSATITTAPIDADGTVWSGAIGTLSVARLDHSVEAYGYSLVEPDGRRMLPALLAGRGVSGARIGQLRDAGSIEVNGRAVTLAEVSEHRPGQRFAIIMDTRLCDAVYALADRADLLVIESTYLDAEAALAEAHGHLTAGQAARVAARAGVRRLVLTHFSQRYDTPDAFRIEAERYFDGEVVVAEDLIRVPVPPRSPAPPATDHHSAASRTEVAAPDM